MHGKDPDLPIRHYGERQCLSNPHMHIEVGMATICNLLLVWQCWFMVLGDVAGAAQISVGEPSLVRRQQVHV